jgi:hypothetical protein
MLHRVALLRTDVSEEFSLSINRVTRIGELGTMLAVIIAFIRSVHQLLITANIVPSSQTFVTLLMLRHVAVVRTVLSFETSVLTTATWRNIPEDGILHSHRPENHKSYIALTGWALHSRRNVSPVRYELVFFCPRRRHSS